MAKVMRLQSEGQVRPLSSNDQKEMASVSSKVSRTVGERQRQSDSERFGAVPLPWEVKRKVGAC